VGKPSGGSSPEPASYPLGGYEQKAVSVRPRWEDPRVGPGRWIAPGWCIREGPGGANRSIDLLPPGQQEAPPQEPRSIDHSGDPATLSNIRIRSEGEAFAVIVSNPARAGNSAVRNLLCRSARASLSGL
jgi:hypothetical protein